LVNNQFEIVIGLANKLRLDSEKMFKIINGWLEQGLPF
jgi:hypothetical protein